MANGSDTDRVVTAPANKATGYGIIAAAQSAGRALLSVPPAVWDTAEAVIDVLAFLNSIEAASPADPHVTAARQLWKELQAENPALPDVVIADLRWYSRHGFMVTKKPAVRDLLGSGFDAWTNSGSLVLVSDHFGEKYNQDRELAKIVLKHEAKHVEQFLKLGRPSTYFDMIKFEAVAYAQTHDDLQSAGFEGIKGVVDFFKGRELLASEPDQSHKQALIHKKYLPRTAGHSPSSLYIP